MTNTSAENTQDQNPTPAPNEEGVLLIQTEQVYLKPFILHYEYITLDYDKFLT